MLVEIYKVPNMIAGNMCILVGLKMPIMITLVEDRCLLGYIESFILRTLQGCDIS